MQMHHRQTSQNWSISLYINQIEHHLPNVILSANLWKGFGLTHDQVRLALFKFQIVSTVRMSQERPNFLFRIWISAWKQTHTHKPLKIKPVRWRLSDLPWSEVMKHSWHLLCPVFHWHSKKRKKLANHTFLQHLFNCHVIDVCVQWEAHVQQPGFINYKTKMCYMIIYKTALNIFYKLARTVGRTGTLWRRYNCPEKERCCTRHNQTFSIANLQ